MATYDLTNQPISSSFQGLLQIDSGSFLRDGTGSLVDALNTTSSNAISSSYALTASFAENVVDPTWDEIQDKPPGIVSGSSQIDYPDISNIPSGIVSSSTQITDGSGIVSGSSQIDYPQISNIPSGIVSSSSQISDITGSSLTTASVLDDTITLTKGDGSTFDITVDNVQSSSFADNSTSASHAEVADSVLDTNIAYQNQDNNFTGNQNFNDITVSGTGSFAQINYVTGSATIIGDAFIVLNADTPTLRYAGIKVFDTGSQSTASLEWDGDVDSWIVVDEEGKTANLLHGPTGSRGSEVSLTENTLPKGGVDNGLQDSSISDDGSLVTINANVDVSGSVSSTINQSNTHLNPQIITDDVTIPTGLNGLIVGEVSIGGDYIIEGNSEVKVFTEPNLDGYLLKSSFAITSASFDIRIDDKLDTSTYETDSASFDSRVNDNTSNISNKLDTSTYETDSASFDSRIDNVGTGFTTTSSFNDYTQSNDDKVNSLINSTGSFLTTQSYEVDSASFDNRIDDKLDTSTYEVDSASFDSRIDNIVLGTVFATTGSNNFDGNQTITGSLSLLEGALSLSQSTPQNNDFQFDDNGALRFFWSTGTFNMQNGAFQFREAQGYPNQGHVGLLFEKGGFKVQPNPQNLGEESAHSIAFIGNANEFGALNISSYTGSCSGIIYNQTNDFNSPTKLMVGSKFSSSFDDTLYTDMNFHSSGSANISTLKLRPEDPLPSGVLGELAVSGSELYFYDGSSWRTVNLT